MRLLCAVAAVVLAASSTGCQAIQQSRNNQITQASTALRQPAGLQQPAGPHQAIQQAAFLSNLRGGQSCGDACGECCGSGACGPRGAGILRGGQGLRPHVDCGCGAPLSPCDGCGGGGCQSCNGSGVCCTEGNQCINNIVGAVLDCRQTDAAYNFQPGPPAAQTAYPYYTVRGPRDFLTQNPVSIGPTGTHYCR